MKLRTKSNSQSTLAAAPTNIMQVEKKLSRLIQFTLKEYIPSEKNPRIVKDLKSLIKNLSPKNKVLANSDLFTEIVVTALKAVQSNIGRGDLKLLSRSIRELRFAFKIFKNYKGIRKVSIFGSARTKSTHAEYKLAKEFSKRIAEQGYMIITGAGPGIMEAGNHGAGPQNSFGVNIKLPFEQFPNKFIAKQATYIDCRYFFTRKLVFLKEASAGAFFPGGFGTLDEAFELLTLVQTGKCDPMPILLIDIPGGTYWKHLRKFIETDLAKSGKISKEDFCLFKITSSVDEAVDEINHFYSNYHSLRFVGDELVMRLQKPISDEQLDYLNDEFEDILSSGKFRRTEALPAEENQPDLARLPRLVFKFNRINNGRLRQIIDYLNKET